MTEQAVLLDLLMERLAALEAEVQRLKTENAELRCRLEMNSQNSHKPPSSDRYRKKSIQTALPKREKQAPGSKKGAQIESYAGINSDRVAEEGQRCIF